VNVIHYSGYENISFTVGREQNFLTVSGLDVPFAISKGNKWKCWS